MKDTKIKSKPEGLEEAASGFSQESRQCHRERSEAVSFEIQEIAIPRRLGTGSRRKNAGGSR
jgi:hypothetical protein